MIFFYSFIRKVYKIEEHSENMIAKNVVNRGSKKRKLPNCAMLREKRNEKRNGKRERRKGRKKEKDVENIVEAGVIVGIEETGIENGIGIEIEIGIGIEGVAAAVAEIERGAGQCQDVLHLQFKIVY